MSGHEKTQAILLVLAACDLLVILLQAALNRRVWLWYLIALPVLLCAWVWLA